MNKKRHKSNKILFQRISNDPLTKGLVNSVFQRILIKN